MKIGLILMKLKCEECGSRNNEFDESLGETVCSDCGLVLDVEIFEQTTLGIKGGEATHTANLGLFNRELGSSIGGSIKNIRSHVVKKTVNSVLPTYVMDGLHNCNMVFAPFSHLLNQEEMHKLYLDLFNKGVFSTSDTYETRAVSIVYFMLLNQGMPHTFEEVALDLSSEIPKAKKVVKKIKKHVGFRPVRENQHFLLDRVLSKLNAGNDFNKEAVKTMEYFETILEANDYNKTVNHYECICWITANAILSHTEISQKYICEKTNRKRDSLMKNTKTLLSYLNMTKVKEIRGKKLW